MKKWKTVGLIFSLFFLFTSTSIPQKRIEGPNLLKYRSVNFSDNLNNSLLSGSQTKAKPFVMDQVLVKFRSSTPHLMRRISLDAYQADTISIIPKIDVYQIKIPENTSVEEMVYLMKMNPFIAYAEPNYIAHIAATPNDPFFNQQYALSNTGQMIGNVPGSPQGKKSADIHAPSGWEEETGKDSVIIGFVDTGLDFDH
ncbi:MAG: peptidase S8, partial [Candidatus Aminicenantes bacterium]|nr:peptidase S8 [Candidatus Aminicenantes bacterium]